MKPSNINDRIESLARLNAAEVQRLYRETFNAEPPAGSPECARRRIAWRWQELADGGLPESARQHALGIAAASPARTRIAANASRRAQGLTLPHSTTTELVSDHDRRLPMPGSIITKTHKGRMLIVRVLEDGFEFDRRRFSSLSAIARDVTGTKWNGYAFFGLEKGEANAR